MLVSEAKRLAVAWVRSEGSNMPGLLGAFIAGSVTTLPDDMPLPRSSDVDITMVLEQPPARKLGKFSYRGVLLEVSFEAPEKILSIESVLGDPHLAGGVKAMQIVSDPSGNLESLQSEVAEKYACPRWVRERCRATAALAASRLRPPDRATPLHDAVTAWLFATSLTALILLLAGLRPPTVRRRYVEVRKFLLEYGRPDFHEALLQVLGCSEWSQSQAEKHLDAVANAFDRAKCLPKGNFPYAADISDAARPVAIGGTRELIEQGLQREAVFWMVATYSRCQWIFDFNRYHDKACRFRQDYLSMISDLGIGSRADLEANCSQGLAFLPRVMEMAEAVMDATPEMK